MVVLALGLTALVSTALSAPAQASPKSIKALSTIALWHMDETIGPMVDSVDGHDGTVVSVTRGVTGFTGKAYKFNGHSSEVTVPTSTSLDAGTGTYSVTVYVNFTKTPQQLGEDSFDLIRKGLSGAQYWKLEISLTGKFGCHFTGSQGTVDVIGTGAVLNDGVWHKLNCRKTSTKVQMFVDGVKVFEQNTVIGTVSNTNLLAIGFKKDPNTADSDFYKGVLDEAMIAIT